MPSAAVSSGPTDPHAIGTHVAGLGMFTRRNGRLALGILSAVLEPDERVELMVVGRYRGHPGVAALTDSRIVFVNDREWEPDVKSVPVAPGLNVQGWQDDRNAVLVFESGGESETIDQIAETEGARAIAERTRSRIGG